MMDEDQKCWKDMAKLMMKINKKEIDMFNTVHIKDHVTI